MGKLLVTGGAGYVGAHTVHHLIATGTAASAIVVFDNLERGHPEFVPAGVELFRGDLRQRDDIRALFQRYEIDAVIHFAAYAYIGESMQRPELYFENNIVGALNLVEAAREAGCRAIVFSSTCAVFGTPERLPITEETPTRPVNPYGESKHAVENILKWYAQIHGIRSICLRYFNAAGAGYGIGEWHEPETHLIPLVLQSALGRGGTITVNGGDYPTHDGTCIRDYVHVLDLAGAHVDALRVLRDRSIVHERVNIGTGVGTSVLDVVRISRIVTGAEIEVRMGERRPGDPAELYADPGRARKLLDWTPAYGAHEIIRDAWAWHLSPQRSF